MIDKTDTASPEIHVAPSPHVSNMGMTTRGMMRDVLIALVPVTAAAFLFFGWLAAKQLIICLAACLAAEAVFTHMRGKQLSLTDLSAIVTGCILGLSLPATAPWYVGCIGSIVAIGIGKIVFGGLGMNIFNPAMVGRAFVMIAFAGSMAASGYILPGESVDVISQATPLTAFKQSGMVMPLASLVLGSVNGSLGETSVVACLLGGIYLCWRRAAAWEIPAGILTSVLVLAGIVNLVNLTSDWTVLHQMASGSLLFGAFFIATDPVTSPLTARGRWIYGVGIGAVIMLLRLFSGYPEGVMFAVLLMNALTPLINRWNIPRPFGGA
ncbi:MAG: RnfABCDGE type electron transport complex subunit D [Deltaproteobacteria bacterium]|nr:RnfABCDGE type electron transport complex subunit D [Deltaproteobacteria bacterium]